MPSCRFCIAVAVLVFFLSYGGSAWAEPASVGFLSLDLPAGWEMQTYKESKDQVVVFLFNFNSKAGTKNYLAMVLVTGQADVKGVGNTLEAQTKMVAGLLGHSEAPLNKISVTGACLKPGRGMRERATPGPRFVSAGIGQSGLPSKLAQAVNSLILKI